MATWNSNGTPSNLQSLHDSSASDGDTITIPSGSFTWTTGVTITKNISIIGAGEDVTTISENMSRANNPGIFTVNLTHELDSDVHFYNFRLSGMTLKSLNATTLGSDQAMIELTGLSHTTDTNPPYIRGCVSRCRLDHMKWDNLSGLSVLIDSCLGVGDHITVLAPTALSTPIMKVFMNNWTPDVNPADGTPITPLYTAIRGYGSWADDTYWGTDKWWFFEDCNFTIINTSNVCDNEEAGRCVFRHNTVTTGKGYTSHGMEGRAEPGVRAHEVYNNYFISTVGFAQHRSGTLLHFNNRSTAMPAGPVMTGYRVYTQYGHWGSASGDNRYDINPVGVNPLVTGTITAVAPPGGAGADTITVGAGDDLSSIDLTDGSCYAIMDLSDPFTSNLTHETGTDNDLGWQYYQSNITGIAGKVLSLQHFSSAPRSANWQVGHSYKIVKTLSVWGACGHGKCNLLNSPTTGGLGSYVTYTYPSNSGTKATTPLKMGQGGSTAYPLDPCYSWNNTDDTYGYRVFGGLTINPNIKLGRDCFNLLERTIETQNVGYPAVTYTRATSNWPDIGANSDIPYAPYTYPHPLTGATVGSVILITGDMDFGNVIIGQSLDSTLTIANTGDELLTVTNITMPTRFTLTGSTSFTVAAGDSTNRTVTFTPLLEQLYSGNITVTSDNDSGSEIKACTGTGVPPAGGGHGKGKKGAMVRRT